MLNDRGQVFYNAIFTDLSEGLFLFTPELRWRSNVSGDRDAGGNWTLGIAPAIVHDVRIDPSNDVTVTGSASDRQVRTLTLGGGAGLATLNLAGGRLDTTDGLSIAANGILTGAGVVGGSAKNQGIVRAQNLTFEGGCPIPD